MQEMGNPLTVTHSLTHSLTYLFTRFRMGHKEILDGMIKDGLWDPYSNIHMGNCGEICAKAHHFTREMMDEYTISTFTKAQNAFKNGLFHNEIVPVAGDGGAHSLIHSLTHLLLLTH